MYDSMVMLSVGTAGAEDRGSVFQDLSELAKNLDVAHGYVSVSTSRIGEDSDDVDYCNREHLHHDDETLNKVREVLNKYFADTSTREVINELQNAGILFRERHAS